MITKRLLGFGFTAVGLLLVVGPFVVDMVRASGYQEVGPTQRIALYVGGAFCLLGLSLIPLGDKPA